MNTAKSVTGFKVRNPYCETLDEVSALLPRNTCITKNIKRLYLRLVFVDFTSIAMNSEPNNLKQLL